MAGICASLGVSLGLSFRSIRVAVFSEARRRRCCTESCMLRLRFCTRLSPAGVTHSIGSNTVEDCHRCTYVMTILPPPFPGNRHSTGWNRLSFFLKATFQVLVEQAYLVSYALCKGFWVPAQCQGQVQEAQCSWHACQPMLMKAGAPDATVRGHSDNHDQLLATNVKP